jgi:hypothetical protein
MTKEDRAAYMRGYRKTVEPLKEREAREAGFKAGVMACVELVKKRGEFQLAVRLARIAAHESFESEQRRAFVQTLNPSNGTGGSR